LTEPAPRLIDLGLFQITPEEGADCVKMLCNDAKELAGIYHGKTRSAKFRASWPDERKFASVNWKSFVQAVIEGYAGLLGGKHVREEDKRRMYIARLMWQRLEEGKDKDNRLQMRPNSQQFVGDPFENRRIVKDFGTHAHSRARLLNSVAPRF
jgi:hypothetical protein